MEFNWNLQISWATPPCVCCSKWAIFELDAHGLKQIYFAKVKVNWPWCARAPVVGRQLKYRKSAEENKYTINYKWCDGDDPFLFSMFFSSNNKSGFNLIPYEWSKSGMVLFASQSDGMQVRFLIPINPVIRPALPLPCSSPRSSAGTLLFTYLDNTNNPNKSLNLIASRPQLTTALREHHSSLIQYSDKR